MLQLRKDGNALFFQHRPLLLTEIAAAIDELVVVAAEFAEQTTAYSLAASIEFSSWIAHSEGFCL